MKQTASTSKRTEQLDARPWPASEQPATYEERLDADLEWAMSEGSRFFEGQGAVQQALKKVTARLEQLGVAYAVVGGMALFAHGFRRFTEDVDVLVTREGLEQIHRRLQGLGYRPPFEGSKNLRDVDSGVKIGFLVAGQYPGDDRPKPVAFPDPAGKTVEREGIHYINLATLIELKIASGMRNPERMKDLADVLELIKVLSLPPGYAEKLNEYVREKYLELWNAAHQPRKRHIKILQLSAKAGELMSLEEVIDHLRGTLNAFEEMMADGIEIERGRGRWSDRIYLVTTDAEVARKYGLHDETEFFLDRVDGDGDGQAKETTKS